MTSKARKYLEGALLSVALASMIGCGQGVSPSNAIATGSEALANGNGLDPNGLDGNGMDGNGLDPNGLDPNGLDANGLDANGWSAAAASQFRTWFTNHLSNAGANSDKMMKYLAKCAVASGHSFTFLLPGTSYSSSFCYPSQGGTTCSYPGVFGLAPNWVNRQPIPVNEQEKVSACLAAHVNALGASVTVSFRSVTIGFGGTEMSAYPYFEAAFFGNLFNGSGVYMSRANPYGCTVTYPRGCSGDTFNCAPLNVLPMTGTPDCDIPAQPGAVAITCAAGGITWNNPITTYVTYPY